MVDELAPGELPVIGPDGIPPSPDAGPASFPRRRFRRPPKGNTKAANAPLVRAQVVAQATGQTIPEPEEWRGLLKDGERSKASSAIVNRRHTHNSGSGFGLA